jgi:hypothetical protein
MKPVLRRIGDAGEDVGQPGLRIDVVEFRRLCRPPNYAERIFRSWRYEALRRPSRPRIGR